MFNTRFARRTCLEPPKRIDKSAAQAYTGYDEDDQ
jgi:hypothetical protein